MHYFKINVGHRYKTKLKSSHVKSCKLAVLLLKKSHITPGVVLLVVVVVAVVVVVGVGDRGRSLHGARHVCFVNVSRMAASALKLSTKK